MAIVEQAASAEQVAEFSAVEAFLFPIHLAHRTCPGFRIEHRKFALDEAPIEPSIVRNHHGSRTAEVLNFLRRDYLPCDHLAGDSGKLGNLNGDCDRWFAKTGELIQQTIDRAI